VQLTPPGSACSITFGIGLGTGEPGSVKGLHLVVTDIEATHRELTGRGMELDEIRHMTPGGWVGGVDPDRADYASYSGFSDPDGNTFVLQEVGHSSS
jgi:hypothetical protein